MRYKYVVKLYTSSTNSTPDSSSWLLKLGSSSSSYPSSLGFLLQDTLFFYPPRCSSLLTFAHIALGSLGFQQTFEFHIKLTSLFSWVRKNLGVFVQENSEELQIYCQEKWWSSNVEKLQEIQESFGLSTSSSPPIRRSNRRQEELWPIRYSNELCEVHLSYSYM